MSEQLTFENHVTKTARGGGRLREDSQCAKILKALRLAKNINGGWLAMPSLVRASGSYNIHSRVDELRNRWGHNIENHTDTSVRPHVSRYRLIEGDAFSHKEGAL